MDAQNSASVGQGVVEVGGPEEQGVAGVRDLCHGTKSHKEGHLVSEVVLVCGQGSEHLSGTLRVADVGDLLSISLGLNSVNDGR